MEIKHQNVCAFVGAFLDPSRAILVWEYCAKGSLSDIIWNRNIKLDQMFMFALSHDVAKVGIYFSWTLERDLCCSHLNEKILSIIPHTNLWER